MTPLSRRFFPPLPLAGEGRGEGKPCEPRASVYFIDGASLAASCFVQTFVDAFTLTE
jgi:hypothetical protein